MSTSPCVVCVTVCSDTSLVFPSSYPSGCVLGCVCVTDCLSRDDYHEQVSELSPVFSLRPCLQRPELYFIARNLLVIRKRTTWPPCCFCELCNDFSSRCLICSHMFLPSVLWRCWFGSKSFAFWYWLIWVVLEKGPLNVCVRACVCACLICSCSDRHVSTDWVNVQISFDHEFTMKR